MSLKVRRATEADLPRIWDVRHGTAENPLSDPSLVSDAEVKWYLNEAIFLVSEYQALAETMPPRQALTEAALNRLRPITMSTLAMVLALLPLGAAISGSGDQMLQPLAIAIIADILVQLPLVLLAMPVVIGLVIRK